MQPTHRAAFCLFGFSFSLVLAGGCGQNEGGRCQVDSDCASGLVCRDGMTGNGTCISKDATNAGRDASSDLGPDASLDLRSNLEEAGKDVALPEDIPGLDTVPVDTVPLDGTTPDGASSGPMDGPMDVPTIDSGEQDSAPLDSPRERAVSDTAASEAAVLDAGEQG